MFFDNVLVLFWDSFFNDESCVKIIYSYLYICFNLDAIRGKFRIEHVNITILGHTVSKIIRNIVISVTLNVLEVKAFINIIYLKLILRQNDS